MTPRTLNVCRSILFGRAAIALELLSVVLLAAGCSAGDPKPDAREAVVQTRAALQGADGPATIAAANTVVNQYTALAADALAGSTAISVQSAAALNPGADPLAAGDLLLVVQMQGATIDTSNAAASTWGQVTSLGNAGNYELVEVASVAGNTVTLACGLKNAYSIAGNVQVVRVPQYTTLTVQLGASITAPAWNGTTGGVVAVRVQNAITLNGDIDVSGKGFRGGVADNTSAAATVDTNIYSSALPDDGGNKGEGIAGQRAEFGRGAAANGGGGGNAHNAGGGGGANARKVGQTAWTGQGVMKDTVVGATAWNLDPAGGVGIRSNSEGGGRGGYTYSNSDQNALAVAPGNALWAGNSRREHGGLGGRPLDPSVTTKLFLGGGGGAGDVNNGNPGAGAAGGGLAFVIAGSITSTGTGRIRANGAKAVDADATDAGSTSGDAPGGGGGGGTVVVKAATLANISIAADGGAGGNELVNNGPESEGPGGGGGGGFVAVTGTKTAVAITAAGATAGTTTSPALTEFPSNGATFGNDGVADALADALALCTAPPDTSFTTTEPNPTNDTTGDFVFASTVPGSSFECRVDNAAFAACSATFSTAVLGAGSHTIDVRAVDPAGFRDLTPATYTWVVDLTAPDTTIVTSEPSPTNDPTGDFTFSSTDATATFECSVDNAAFAACAASFSTAALADGSHTIAVRAKDTAGNVDATPAIYSWVVDSTAPDTTIPTKEPNPTNDPTADFGFASDDAAASFECSVDSAAFTACPATFSTPTLADGPHTISVRAKDLAGNVDATPATYSWVVDTAAPDTTIPTKEPNPTNDATADFVFASDDATASFECSVDSAAFVACSATFSTAALADGQHTLSVRAVDASGNVDATPATYAWLVDTTAPDTAIDLKPTNPTTDTTGDFTFTSNDAAASFECSLDGAAFAACTQALTTPALPVGGHTLQVRAKDVAGNVDATPASYTWTVNALQATDTDGDGLSDDDEKKAGTNPNDADSDDDGVPDGSEQQWDKDSDGDGLINALDPDSDNDGLFDGTELGLTTPNKDTDLGKKNFVADADPTTKTNPLKADTDAGGIPDGAEDPNHNGKIDPGERNPNDPADDATKPKDTDGDGLTDAEEGTLGTDPNDADSDDDGVLDGAEPNPSGDTDGDGLINALDPDSDNDGLLDGTELGVTVPNKDTDVSKKHFVADADPGTKTSAVDPDTDHGGVHDGAEDFNLDGALDADEGDPLDPKDDKDIVDTDGDGLSDGTEATIGTEPNDADSDDDGVIDGNEPNPTLDDDGDGKIDALDPDSDGDGLFDGTELGLPCTAKGTSLAAKVCVADADGGATTTSPLDPDTDHGGVKDGVEDANHDGKLETGETDPNEPSDDSRPVGDAGAGGMSGEGGASEAAGASGMGPSGGTENAGAENGGVGNGGTSNGGVANAGAGNGGAGNGGVGGYVEPGVVVLGGGICSVSAPGHTNSQGALWLVVCAAALAATRRRQR